MAEPIKLKTMGGLTFDKNQVKSAEQLEGGTYEIVFKSGERLTYPEQEGYDNPIYTSRGEDPKIDGALKQKYVDANGQERWIRNARVDVRVDKGLIYDDTYFDIANVMGAKFTSSKDNVCHVSLSNSSDTTIDLSANDSKVYPDTVCGNNANGRGNKVILDEKDKITYDFGLSHKKAREHDL